MKKFPKRVGDELRAICYRFMMTLREQRNFVITKGFLLKEKMLIYLVTIIHYEQDLRNLVSYFTFGSRGLKTRSVASKFGKRIRPDSSRYTVKRKGQVKNKGTQWGNTKPTKLKGVTTSKIWTWSAACAKGNGWWHIDYKVPNSENNIIHSWNINNKKKL